MKHCFSLIIAALLAACGTATPPDPEITVLRLRGSPEEMGFQHGQRLQSDIRALYARFLQAQVLPYLNRQQESVSKSLFYPYDTKPAYANGQFSYQFLLDSAKTLDEEQPADYLAEMEGLARGSGMSLEKIKVLNTFGDTLLGLLAVSFYQEREAAPQWVSVTFTGLADGADNDYDGLEDEADEDLLYFEPLTVAALNHVGPGKIKFLLRDEDGVSTANLQILVNGKTVPARELKISANSATETTVELDTTVYWSADWNTISVQASDLAVVDDVLPSHPHTSRMNRITVGGLNTGAKAKSRAANAGLYDSLNSSSSYSVARNDGSVVARNFVLLDGNTAHDHTALLIFEPSPTLENPAPQRYAMVGWAGAGWALTGMNEAGQSVTVNLTETLDNGVARGIELGKQPLPRSRGMTFGAVGRTVLARNYSPEEFIAAMSKIRAASGVIVQLADGPRQTVTTCELRAGNSSPVTAACYGTGATSPAFRIGADYTSTFSAFRAFSDDAAGKILESITLVPQRFWSTEWAQSYTTYGRMQALLEPQTGELDAREWIRLMRAPGMTSKRNSMQSAVIFPGKEMWIGIGRLPSTDSQFQRFTAKELFP